MAGHAQRWFVEAVRRHPRRSIALVSLSVLTSLAEGLSISLLIPFLSTLFGGAGLGLGQAGPLSGVFETAAGLAGPGHELVALSGLIVGLVAAAAVLGYAETLIAAWVSGRIGADLRARVHANLLAADFEFICVNDNARLLNTLDSETWAATEAVTAHFRLFASVCMAAVFAGVLMLLSWRLTLLVGVLTAGISLLMFPFNAHARAVGRAAVGASEDLTERAVDLFDGMRMIRAFGRERQEQARYEAASARLFAVSMRGERVGGAAHATQEILYAFSFVAIVFAGMALNVGGAALVAYLALLHRMQPHVRAIDGARTQLASLDASSRAVADLLALPSWPPAGAGRVPAGPNDAVRFEGVSFAYAGKAGERRNALEDVTLSFPVGEATAVVGWSGAGKSTLTNLLFRFYDPDAGRIVVDGEPLTDLDLAWWRGRLAIAGQDAELIGGTIADNIAYGTAGATREMVVAAARRAAAHDFIQGLPRGYDTEVGGRGLLLSGGQRQRIGLARAFVREGAILVLDEATNALDSLTEHEILTALESARGLTVIVIAHRLSTTRMADQVVVLAEGRVAEQGTPADLLKAGGLYARMVALQDLHRPATEPET